MATYVERPHQVVAHKILDAETLYGACGQASVDILTVEGFDQKISSMGITSYIPGKPPGGYLMRDNTSFGYCYVPKKQFESRYVKAE